MKTLLKIIGVSLFVGMLSFACTEDYFEFDKLELSELNPELAVPLINSTLTLEDIIIREEATGIFDINDEEVIELRYESNLISSLEDRAYEVPVQRFEEAISQVIPPFNGGQPQSIILETEIEFEDEENPDVEIDSMILNGGQLAFNLENEYPYDVELTITLSSFTDTNGDTLELTFNLGPGTLTNPAEESRIIDLTGFKINLTEDANGNPTVNNAPVQTVFTVNLENGVGAISGEEFRISGAISEIDFRELYGYLGNVRQELERDTFDIELFRNFISSEFFISNPSLDITVRNSFAVPIELNFLSLDAMNTRTNQSLAFNIPSDLQPFVLQHPERNGSEITRAQLNRDNSNLDSIVSFFLDKVSLSADIQLNPDGVPPPGEPRNFISDTSSISMDAEFVFPFEGRTVGLFVEDTVDFEFDLADELDDGLIRIVAENRFPLEVRFQLIFLDSIGTSIDSLFSGGDSSILSSPSIDSNGDVLEAVRKLTDISVDRERLQNLSLARRVVVRAQLNTVGATNGTNIRLQSSNDFAISLGLRAKLLIDEL